jgi:hypothetical protein
VGNGAATVVRHFFKTRFTYCGGMGTRESISLPDGIFICLPLILFLKIQVKV